MSTIQSGAPRDGGANGLTKIDEPWVKRDGIEYFAYTCSKCGAAARNTYCEPIRSRMLANRHCFSCDFWEDMDRKIARDHARMTIIAGHIYSPGNRTTGEMRGMAGRRFDIEYIEPSIHAGKRITTFDLWSGSTLPDDLKAKYPDTARFLDGAKKVQVGETTCWNPSDHRGEPYPLPLSLGIGR